jgi:hypothetical protein
MSTVTHQFVISSREVANWLDSQPGTWWVIDGDFSLIGKVDFPCPNDELAEALRELDKNIIIYTNKTVDLQEGRQISARELPLLADTQNRYQNRDYFASWEGSDNEWILTEDKDSAEAFAEDAMEEWDAEGKDGSEPED